MVSLDAAAQAHDGVTLVTATLEGGPVPTRVSLRNRLDGPVWPPRRLGEPVAGWDENGYDGVVPEGESVALGYACPAPPADPPLELVATERAGGDHGAFETASDVLRGLGSPAPPRDAVPIPAPVDGDAASEAASSAGTDADPSAGADTDPSAGTDVDPSAGTDAGRMIDAPVVPLERNGDADSAPDDVPEPSAADSPSGVATDRPAPPDSDLPGPVTAWLDGAERRIERAEALADASDVPAATEAVRAVGSLDDVETLECRRSTDAELLREVATRANALAYRAEAATVPLETLERLA